MAASAGADGERELKRARTGTHGRTMKAIRMGNSGELSLRHLPIPTPGARDVLVRVTFSGICGTDLHILSKEFPAMEEGILGHEFCGEIVAIGPGVSDKEAQIGQMVAVDPNEACDMCHFCHSGKTNHCVVHQLNSSIGIHRDGGWAEFAKVPIHMALAMPAGIQAEQGVLCEPLSCIVNGWDRMGPVAADASVLVIGSGIIGVLWTCLFHHRGCRRMVVSENADARRKVIADLQLPGVKTATSATVAESCPSPDRGYDIIVDCSGNPAAVEHAFTLLAPGATLVQFGCCPKGSAITIDPHVVFSKELTITGSKIDKFSFGRAIALTADIADTYFKDTAALGVRMYGLDQYKEALATLKEGTICKAIFDLSL